MVNTKQNIDVDNVMIYKYFSSLINRFFKILPMYESEESSLPTYIESLQIELLGFNELIVKIDKDPYLLQLIFILEYLRGTPSISTKIVKREVFRAISICERLRKLYSSEVDDGRME